MKTFLSELLTCKEKWSRTQLLLFPLTTPANTRLRASFFSWLISVFTFRAGMLPDPSLYPQGQA